jgi:hypothetical protein
MRKTATLAIERRPVPTREEFEREYVAKNRPAIFTGALDRWPAMKQWSESYVREKVGSREAVVDIFPDGDYYNEFTIREERMTVAQYLHYLDHPRNDKELLCLMPELRTLPELESDVILPELFDHKRIKNVRFHLRRNSVTINHYHPLLEALLCHVFGEKKVVLYRPEDTRYLYPWPFYRFPMSASSRINFHAPDYRKFPNLRKARPLEFDLHPGDMLYIPLHWWHWVVGQGSCSSVAMFWWASYKQWQFPDPGLRVLAGIPIEKLRYFITGKSSSAS